MAASTSPICALKQTIFWPHSTRPWAIGQSAGVPVQIYHLKAAGKRNWPKMTQAIARINRARQEGLDITADLYPYVAGGTGLASVLPPWAAEGNRLLENLRDPATRARIRAEALDPAGDWEALAALCGPEGVMPIGLQNPDNQAYVGKSLAEIGALRDQLWVDAAIDLFLSEAQRISALYFWVDEENLRRQIQEPWVTIGTDAGGLDPAWAAAVGPTHPAPMARTRVFWVAMCVKRACSRWRMPCAR